KHPRFGWEWHDANLKDFLVINETEAEIVRWAASEYANGTSASELVRLMTERGIPSPTGKQRWQIRTLLRMLTDERNIGRGAQFNQPNKKAKRNLGPVELPEGTYPALIDEETYQLILMRTKTNQEEASRNGSAPENYLLRAGFIKCPVCKRNMLGVRTQRAYRQRQRVNFLYVCQKSAVCQGYRVQAHDLDTAVWNDLLELADHISLIEEAVKLATNHDNTQANLKTVERTIKEWQRKADQYTEDLEDTRLKGASRAAIRKLLDDALEMVGRLEGEKQKLLAGEYNRQREQEAYADILAWCRTVKTAREPLSYTKQRDFLRLLGVVVYVNHVARKKSTPISYDIKLRLPALQQLVQGKSVEIGSHCSRDATCNLAFFVGIKAGVWYINPALGAA